MLPTKLMNRKWAGSSYGLPSIESAHFVAIQEQTWPPQAILISDWSISKGVLEAYLSVIQFIEQIAF
jgi:hypothetical protein